MVRRSCQVADVIAAYPPGQSGIDGGGYKVTQIEPNYLPFVNNWLAQQISTQLSFFDRTHTSSSYDSVPVQRRIFRYVYIDIFSSRLWGTSFSRALRGGIRQLFILDSSCSVASVLVGVGLARGHRDDVEFAACLNVGVWREVLNMRFSKDTVFRDFSSHLFINQSIYLFIYLWISLSLSIIK